MDISLPQDTIQSAQPADLNSDGHVNQNGLIEAANKLSKQKNYTNPFDGAGVNPDINFSGLGV